MSKKVTIGDIAAAAGVSKATVSYVLNGKSAVHTISDATVTKIFSLCKQFGYQPDPAAVALSAQKKKPLRLLILSPWLYGGHSDFMSQIYSTLYSEFSDTVFPTFTPYKNGLLSKVLRPSLYRKYDAVLLIGTVKDDEEYIQAHTEEYGGKLIILNRTLQAFGIHAIAGNDFSVETLLGKKLGYYDRYFIIQKHSVSRCCAERCRALTELFKEKAVECDAKTFSAEDLLPLVQNGQKICCCFTLYQTAAQFLVQLQQYPIDIPHQIGIIGYDIDTLLSSFLPKQLTTVDSHIPEMLRRACAIAAKIKIGEAPPEGSLSVVEGEIIPGETALLTETPQ